MFLAGCARPKTYGSGTRYWACGPIRSLFIVFRYFNVFSLMKQKTRHSHARQKNNPQLDTFDLYRPKLKLELQDAYQNHDQDGIIDALYNYMIAATVFYGVVSYQDFQFLIKYYTNIEIDNQLFLDTLNYAKLAYQNVNINGELFAIYSFLEDTLEPNDYIPYIQSVIDARIDKSMRILPEDEFIQYINPLYIKMTPVLDEVCKHIKKHRLCIKQLYKNIDEMLFFFRLAAQFTPYKPMALMFFIALDKNRNASFDGLKAMRENLDIFIDAYNDIPLWHNYGWSPNDLPVSDTKLTPDSFIKKLTNLDLPFTLNKSKEKPESNDIEFVLNHDDSRDSTQTASSQTPPSEPKAPEYPKVGRNEPCPCGSGKKYKHCHGKS